MAKLTLSFKDRKLKVFGLESSDCIIGRESDCTIPIDSLAIAPRHAQVRASGQSFVVEALDSGAHILVNGEAINEPHELNEGDQIQIGKHTLSFSTESDGVRATTTATHLPRDAWLQIHTGSHLGRTIRLDKAFTRIGKPDGNLAVVARREDGYYLSHLQGDSPPQINERDIGEKSTRLKDKDIVSVGRLRVQFYSNPASDSSATHPTSTDRLQRRYTRIPFDVPVTLNSTAGSWDTELIDISLHGALIKAPAPLAAATEHQYQLCVHLDGGHNICMDVVIAHQRDDELGLRCVDIDLESVTHLRRLIELNLGETELVERELSALG